MSSITARSVNTEAHLSPGDLRQSLEERFATALARCSHPLSIEFVTAMLECIELHALKGADYGRDEDPFANIRSSEEFGLDGWRGSIIRGNDKMSRLKAYCRKGSLENEGVEDSFKDLANYAIIALTLFREESGKAATA